MKVKWPSFGSYILLHNAKSNAYPWIQCIRNALTFSDTVYLLDVDSSPEDTQAIYDEFKDEQRIVLKRLEGVWDMDDMAIVGRMKQLAREMVSEQYCIYLDCDEILKVSSRESLIDLVLNNVNDVISVPYITFFGTPYQVADFPESENWWRWKIFKNLPNIGHGIHGAARKYDENGKVYMDKKTSDGCEIINLETLEIMPSILYMPPQYAHIGQIYKQAEKSDTEKAKISVIFSEVINDFPIVCLHYGWVNFKNKADNAIKYWTKTKAFKTNVEHSNLFNGLTEDKVVDKINEWSGIPTIPLHIKSHPDVIKPYLIEQMKPKILTISLANHGPFGVPLWNNLLRQQLEQYEVQNLAFNDYVANMPQESTEVDKAQSFINFIKTSNMDRDAMVIFADGFWAATYTGKAKVVSVIHGLWSHPLRDKWDDGILEQRKQLFNYQIAYYKKAKEMGHTLICVSPFIQKILKEEHGVDSILISNSVDLDFWDSIRITHLEKTKPLIMHGITSNNKGLDILKQIENHPKIKDVFDIASIDDIVKHTKVPKPVVFKVADVALLPTKWEASSYLLLECLANSTPIAAYRAGILNCKDLRHIDDIGVIVDEYDVEKFVDAILEAYNNSIKYRMGRVFLRENDMTIDKWTAKIKRLIYEIL